MAKDVMLELSEALQRCQHQRYDRAWSMPRSFYTDPAVLALERERLFLQEWVCVGRAEELPQVGDYLAFQICDEPVVVIHGEDGAIRAFSNVCRHRGAVIASGKGSRRRLVCPYHHWSYDTLGRLVGAPGIGEREDFDRRGCGL